MTSFFFRELFASFHTHASLLAFFVCFFILFHSCCSHARVFGKTIVHESLFPTAILNGTCFSDSESTSAQKSVFGAKKLEIVVH